MRRLINIISSIILLILALIIAVIFAPKLFSIEPMVVVSGSMEPSYMKGSLLYVKEGAGGIQTGDAITFYRNGELVTHRVVEINTDEKTYTTKGDANQVNDVQPVAWSDVVGVPVFDIPVLGYPASFLGTSQGKFVFIVLLIIFTGITVLTDKKWRKQMVKKVIRFIVLIIGLSLVAYSGYHLFKIYSDYNTSDKTYEKLQDEYAVDDSKKDDDSTKGSEAQSPWYDDIDIDFAGLRSETLMWLAGFILRMRISATLSCIRGITAITLERPLRESMPLQAPSSLRVQTRLILATAIQSFMDTI